MSTSANIDETIAVDHASLLASCPGSASLAAVERTANGHGLTLGVDLARGIDAMTVAEWLGGGARGAASMFSDPADHLVAGLEARLPNGERFTVHPCPRRAVGPDLVALAFGTKDAGLAIIERASLRLHRKGERRPDLPLPGVDLDPPVDPAEQKLVDAIRAALTSHR